MGVLWPVEGESKRAWMQMMFGKFAYVSVDGRLSTSRERVSSNLGLHRLWIFNVVLSGYEEVSISTAWSLSFLAAREVQYVHSYSSWAAGWWVRDPDAVMYYCGWSCSEVKWSDVMMMMGWVVEGKREKWSRKPDRSWIFLSGERQAILSTLHCHFTW